MTIEQLEALERSATAGPWITNISRCDQRRTVSISKREEPHKPIVISVSSVGVDDEFIVAARNALPHLLAVAKAAKARLAAWDAAVADPNAACYQCEDDAQTKLEREALARLEAQ